MTITGRGWAALGLAVLFAMIFIIRAIVPELLHDETTNALLTGLEQGGILAFASFYFGSAKKDEPPK